MNFSKASDQFITMTRASGYSTDTVENYSRALRLFSETVELPEEITSSEIAEYKNRLFLKGLKQSTIRAYLEVLNLFFDFCAEMKLIAENPCVSTILKTKVPPKKGYQHLLSREQMELLLQPVCPKGATRKTWPRTYAMTVVFLTSSMRNSELRELTRNDLDFENGTIHIVSGKGDKERWVAFPSVAQDAVTSYMLSELYPSNLSPDVPLFGKGDSAASWHGFERPELSGIIERYVKLVTGEEDVRTHALRHNSASLLFDSGLHIDDIQDLLGHANSATTRIYADRLKNTQTARATSVFDSLKAV